MSEVNPQYTDAGLDDARQIINGIKARYGEFETVFGRLPRVLGASKHAVALYVCGFNPPDECLVPYRLIDTDHVHDEFPGMENRTFRYAEIFRQSGFVGFSLLEAFKDRQDMMNRTDVFGLPVDTSQILTLNDSIKGLQLGGIDLGLAKMVDEVFPEKQRVIRDFSTIFEEICKVTDEKLHKPTQA